MTNALWHSERSTIFGQTEKMLRSRRATRHRRYRSYRTARPFVRSPRTLYRLLPLLLLPLLLTSSALGQRTDWRAVQALPAGTKIKVQLKHGRTFGHCFFDGATNDQLACSIPGPIWMGSRRAAYPRNNVKAVFWTHNGALIGFGVGATTGAILGASKDPVPGLGRGGTALLVGGVMGGVGAFFGMVADPFFHGKAVYRSSRMAPSNASPNQHIDIATTQTEPTQREEKIPCLRDGKTLQCLNPSPVDAVEDDNGALTATH